MQIQPFYIDNIVVNPPVVLAPMEAVTSRAFRKLVIKHGKPGLFVTEFISAMAVHYNPNRQWEKLDIGDDEHPIAVQIFGSEPDIMAESAKRATDSGADLVDINMGCWVPKVCRTGSGAALLKDIDLAVKIAETVVKAVNSPVTAKIRAGWDISNINCIDLAKRLEEVGIKAITLHARTAKQQFHGTADWSIIQELKSQVAIPVIGNGDIKRPEDALRMFSETHCDGIMIGRAAIGYPWIIGETNHYLKTGEELSPPTINERIETAIEHVEYLTEAWQSELRAVRHLRGQLPLYIKGIHDAAGIREQLSRASTLSEVRLILEQINL